MTTHQMARLLQAATLLFVAGVLVSQALLLAPGLRATESVSTVWSTDANGTEEVEVSVTATFAGHFTASTLQRGASNRSDQIYFYFDGAYPVSYSAIPYWYGLSQHLTTVAGARGWPMQLQLEDADQLAALLQEPSTARGTVVFASGVLPAPIFSATVDRLVPWMREGGLVVWAGDQIGEYSGVPGQALGCGLPGTLGEAGTARILNVSWLDNNGSGCAPGHPPAQTLFLNTTPDGLAWGVYYPYGINTPAFVISKVLAGGGLALGGNASGDTNIAYIPEGRGGLLDFVGPTVDPIRLSTSIDNVLQSGLLDPGSVTGESRSFAVSPGHPGVEDLWLPSGASGTRPCVFVDQTDYLATFATESCAPDGTGG